MCSRSFTRSLGFALIPLAVCCIVANILLFFPNGEVGHAQADKLTKYVWFYMGITGGGLVMFLPVVVFVNLERCSGWCGSDSCAMCGSVLAALIGLAGSGYCFVISALALTEGPKCDEWQHPSNVTRSGGYLFNTESWSKCKPVSIVEWHITLFSILLALSGLETIICTVQLVNGLVAAVCRPCCYKQRYSLNA